MPAYAVPVDSSQSLPQLSPTPTVGIVYDVTTEYPSDPLRLWVAWANCLWVVVGVYNGK